MTTPNDPVVRDITQYINRSAGQHKRMLRLPVRDTMTPDPYLLHRTHHVDTDDMPEGSGVSVGGLVMPEKDLNHWSTQGAVALENLLMPEAQPVEFAGREPLTLGDWVLVAFVLAVVLLVVFSEPVARWIVRATA